MPDPLVDVPENDGEEGGEVVVKRSITDRMVPLRDMQVERRRVAAAKSEAAEAAKERDALRAQITELQADATSWRDYTAAEQSRITADNAEKMKALPEAAQKALGAISDPVALSVALSALTQATPTVPAKHPIGGGIQQSATGATTLTPDEQTYKTRNPILARADDAKVKRLFALQNKRG